MEREILQNLFCEKIALELEKFKKRMLKKGPEEILNSAYQIDSFINIYEMLLEMSQEISETALKSMLVFPNLLAHFYAEWLKFEDSYREELYVCMLRLMTALVDAYRDLERNPVQGKGTNVA